MRHAERIFRRLLRLFPSEFRGDYGDEMTEMFEEQRRESIVRGGRLASLSFWWHTTRGIVQTAPSEHLDVIRQDVRSSLRMLRRSPTFAVIAIMILAVGIGAMTATFTLVSQVLWRALPYDAASQLVGVRSGQSYLDLRDWSAASSGFHAFGGYRDQPFDVVSTNGSSRVPGSLVTGTFFATLGVRPTHGRLIGAMDDRPGGEHIVVVSHGFWQRHFGGRADVVGQSIDFAVGRYQVVGVLPAGFEMPFATSDVFAPTQPESNEFEFRGVHSLQAIGRLRDGVSLVTAQKDLDAIASRLEQQYPDSNKGRRFVLQDLKASIVGGIERTLWLLFAAVALVFLIVCLNLASLQLARSVDRRPEMAVRTALGARRGRLLRQLFVESFVLSAIGGVAGSFVAMWLLNVMLAVVPADVPRLDRVLLDARVVIVAAAAALVTTFASGWVPAHSATRTAVRRVAGASSTNTARRRVNTVLVAVEIALTVVLMIGAGLLFNSVTRLQGVEKGFDASGRLAFMLTLRQPPRPRTPMPPADQAAQSKQEVLARIQFFDQVIDRLRRLPGVEGVAASPDLPFAGNSSYHNLTIEGRTFPAGGEPEVYYRPVNPGYFQALGIPLRSGRAIAAADRRGAPLVVVANETFVKQYFPGQDVHGKRVRWSEGEWITIVGVAGDVRSAQLDEGDVPALYAPYGQDSAVWRRSMSFAVTVAGEPASIAADVRRAVGQLDPTLPVLNMRVMAELVEESLGPRRLALSMLGLFALTALGLAAVGLYGVIVYSVRIRARELALRIALGARRRSVVGLLVRQACWLTAIGLAIGLALAYSAVGTLRSLIFGITVTDTPTFLMASSVMALIVLGAASIPAARAASIDPVIALKKE